MFSRTRSMTRFRSMIRTRSKANVFVSTAAAMILGSGMLVGGITPAQAQDDSSLAVLTINGKDFSLNLVGSIISQLPENVRNQPLANYYNNVIDDMIDTKLTADAARESGLADNPLLKEIVERAMDRVLAEAWLNDEINRRITDEMIDKSYNDLVADTESRTEVRARHILVNTEDDAKAVIARLDKGEDFAELAKELSTGPSGPNGGELGYFRRGAMVPSFEVASFNLAAGSYTTSPVQTQFGWHVIKAEDRRVADAPALEDVRDQLESTISVKIAGSIITELRNNALITKMSFEDVRAAEQARQQNAQ
ncbi:MAG: peptidylprolyl isomerase [Alphaproteobacteria bacterium]|nr:peptidylprolyl isomerase [Alphaproteobacteria bacterium]